MRKGHQRRDAAWLAAGASGIVLALAPIVNAQDGGLWATLDLSSRLSIDDNLQMEAPSFGVTTSLDNAFTFELASRTRKQSLTFSANGIARAASYPGGTTLFAIEDPGVSLTYSREAASSAMSASASYLVEDLSFVDWTETVGYSFDDFLQFGTGSYSDWIASLGSGDETSYLVSGGTRETVTIGATYEFGKDAPFGGSIGVSRSQVAYADANPGLVDAATDRLTATAHYDITPTLTGSATLNLAQTISGGGTSPSQNLKFGVRQDFDSGLMGLSLNTNLGGTTKASINRTLDWSTGSVSVDIGVAATPDGSGLSAGLGYRQDFKDGVFGASVSSDADSSGVTNSARASYRYEINDFSQLSFAFNYSGNLPNGGAGDQRAKISASYARDITDDIYLNAGLIFDFLDASDADPASSNGVFLSISRTYSFRPW